MEFPIVELLDHEESLRWVETHFHPEGLRCPRCQAPVSEARLFRITKRSQIPVYRCRQCGRTYNVYTGTVFEHHHLTPQQVILLLRGLTKGESTRVLASELGLAYGTVLTLRHEIQAQALQNQTEEPLPDEEVEADEMFQNAGEKGEPHRDPDDPPRRRGNRRRGHGTYENDRPPILGVVGRQSGQVRLRVVKHTDGATLQSHVERFTQPGTRVYTDEWKGYNGLQRPRAVVHHGQKEWARDDYGDGH